MAGIKGKSGPPPNNVNAMRNGGSVTRLTLGAMDTRMQRQLQGARKYRRFLESLTLEAHGKVDAVAAHLIDEATTAEMHAAVCRWLLRTRLTDMKPSDIARCSEQILKSKTIRNRAVERLELVSKPADPWLVLNAPSVVEPSDV